MEPAGKRAKVFESSSLFDVFINHRGPDVKEPLVTELYNSLKQLGIEVFLDSQEKELGKSFPSIIETAIRSAKVHIAIFSPRYAESPWCLTELLLMIESKVKIIPVFYNVKPWELRHIEKGVYRGAFIEYEAKGRFLEKLSEWKKALQTLSFIAGVEFHSFSDYKTIIAQVEKEVLQSRRCLHVAKYPVGLNNLKEDFERRCLDELVQDFEHQCGLAEKKNRPNVVGIFGMGGVGKTTLAKELFNRKLTEYSRASFLFDVREVSARGELHRLQSKLVKDLFHKEESFKSIEEGKSYLNSLLPTIPLNFLIVVDDIDHVEQLEALLITDTLNKSGNSLIIVTTRDVGLMISAEITISYPLKGMDRNSGRQLFCWHAFDNSIPIAGYEALVEQFVDVCGGLPLSLLVLGRLVHGRDLKFWESNVSKAKRTLPRDVKQRLRISFDALDDEEKQVFMDMACFFLWQPKRIAESILEKSGWGAQTALQTLKDKCLIEEIGDCYRMHDHLRDLGREMALELSPPHRLWHPQDLQSMESIGLKTILTKTDVRCFHSIFDESMGCQATFFIGESESKLGEASLLWLQLEGFPTQPSFPAWIPLQDLLYLKINCRGLKTLWENQTQAPSQLKELQISQIFFHEISDFLLISDKNPLNDLESLEIRDEECVSKISIRGIHYPSLQSINLHNMKSLVEVNLTAVKTLKRLEITSCENLKNVSGISNLEELVDLEISDCGELESITLPEKLISLSVRSCRNLQRIEGTDDLMKLENFKIFDCGKLEFEYSWKDKDYAPLQLRELILPGTWSASFEGFPSSISYLSNLKKIALLGDAGKEFGIKGLPEEFCDLQSLEQLELRHCILLSSLPDRFGYLRNLRHLDLCSCKELRMLPVSFKQLTLLNYLDLSDCKRLLLQRDILENITKLKNLYLSGCLALQKMPHKITDQACLRELRLQHTHLKDLPSNIGQLSDLEVLTIGSPLLKSLPDSFGNLSRLKSLSITDCFALEYLPKTLGNLALLEHLCIEATGVRSLPEGFTQLANLRTLKISDCPLSELDFGSTSSFSLEKLTEIKLSETLVTRISISEHCCPRLESLQLSKNDKLEVVEDLPGTAKMRKLSGSETLDIKNIRALQIPLKLTISDCPSN